MVEIINKGFWKDLDKMMEFPKEGIFSKVIVKKNGSDYTLMCLSKGSEIDEHTSTKSGAVLVLKGKGSFVLECENIMIKPGTFIFMPANAKHSLSAEEDLAILLCLSK
jgi:quercetin dioxygenase-like cupin family protein